jgi:hypothetical protein
MGAIVPLNRLLSFGGLHNVVISQKIELFIAIAVRTNPTYNKPPLVSWRQYKHWFE